MSHSTDSSAPKIADVARVAGVSVPTVSRVFNGSTPVSDRLRKKVADAVAELGYRPNSAARALALGRRSIIAVLAGNSSRYGWARTIQGIEVSARQKGLSSIVSVVESAEESIVDDAVDLVLSENVAGVIVLEFDEPGKAILRKLPRTIPIVAAAGGSRRNADIPYALLDERTAGRRVTEHLLSLGHATVHHISQPTMGLTTGRTAGWRAALEAAGAPVPEVLHATWEPHTAYQAGLELARREDVTAVFCANDDIALAVMRALADQGRPVPGSVSVIGFDDLPLAEFWSPSLTTVHQDFDDLGARAFALLAAVIEGGSQRNSVVTPELVLRESATTAARTEA